MASILIVDDEQALSGAIGTFFERQGHQVLVAQNGREGVASFWRANPDLVLLDLRLPDMTGFEVLQRIREADPVVIMMTAHGEVPLAVRAIQEGAENFLTKPVELPHLAAAAERALEKARLRHMSRSITESRGSAAASALRGSSAALRDLTEQILGLARSDRTTVLILGESGTGKGSIAEMLHAHSARAGGPFVRVACSAFEATALDQELFGREDGDGEDRRIIRGLLEKAHEGTLFVDAVGELDPHLQGRLLAVLEGKGFQRVGGREEVRVDVRVVAATDRDLVNEVTAGRFREDLYYRLSTMPVYIPPLRARSREDLLDLIRHLVQELRSQLRGAPDRLSDATVDRLLRHPWPGNLRELRNVLERAMIVARGAQRITPEHLPPEIREASGTTAEQHVPRSIMEVERLHIERTLRSHQGNRTRAAQELGISRATLIKKIKEYGLAAAPARGSEEPLQPARR